MNKHKPLFIALIIITAILIILVAGGIWLIKTQSNVLPGNESEPETSESASKTTREKTELPPSPASKEKQRIESYEGPKNEISLTAEKWSFEPNIINANLGEKIIISATSLDVAHGFALPNFQIRERIEPGQTTTIEFIADQAGKFDFFSHVYSGPESRQMRGKLIVK